MADVQPPFRVFDMATMLEPTTIVAMIGNRACGLSWLVRDVLFHRRDVPIGVAVGPCDEHSASPLRGILPPQLVHDECTPSLIANVVKRQKIAARKAEQAAEGQGETSVVDPRAILVLDGCFYDEAWTHDKHMRALFADNRKYNLDVVVAMEFPLGLPPSMQANVDYVFLLRSNLAGNRTRLYVNFVGAEAFPTYEGFSEAMDRLEDAGDRWCLVIDKRNGTSGGDRVFWYRAGVHAADSVRIGAPAFWGEAP